MNQISFTNLSDLIGYVQYLSANHFSKPHICKFRSIELMDHHSKHANLVLDKYIETSIPDSQLEFLLESQGIMNYDAELVYDKKFKHTICKKGDIVSENFYPNISGDHYNPYIRFKSSSVSGSQQCTKLRDLVGITFTDFDESLGVNPDHETIFNSLVLTYPDEIDLLLLSPVNRIRADYKVSSNGKKTGHLDIKPNNVIDRMNRCCKSFSRELCKYLCISNEDSIGGSQSLHVWSSSIPIIPNAHHHLVVSHFSYRKISKWWREISDAHFVEDIIQKFDCVIADLEIKSNRSKDLGKNGKKYHAVPVEGIVPLSPRISEPGSYRVVVNESGYNSLCKELSDALIPLLDFKKLDWKGSIVKPKTRNGITFDVVIEVPLDDYDIKTIWSRCVYDEFGDILGPFDESKLFDVFMEFIPATNKAKLLHVLQYKTRPPVLDLDMFFKKCPGVVVSYDKVNPIVVLDYIDNLLQVAIKCSDIESINRYESLLKKYESVLNRYSESDIHQWLQFLSTCDSITRVYGFWKDLKRYTLDPGHKFLVHNDICCICGGDEILVRYVNSVIVDSVIIRSRSKFLVYDLGDPGG